MSDRFALFPGCVLTSAGAEALMATRLVAASLGLDLKEVEGWACCGATQAQDIEPDVALAVNARNLTLAGQTGRPLLTVCSTCTMVLRKSREQLDSLDEATLERTVNRHLRTGGLAYQRGVTVTHLLWELDRRRDRLAGLIRNPLTSLRVALFYGCHTFRPFGPGDQDEASSPFAPTCLERVAGVAGVTVTPIAARLDCCGFHALYPARNAALALTRTITAQAVAAGAQAIVTPCPLCQMQLDMFQQAGTVPVLHIGQLVGLAMGHSPKALGMERLLQPLHLA